MTRIVWRLGLALVVTALALTAALALDPPGGGPPPRDPQIGQSFRVPYRLSDTNHFLVRVRINGKGPFNFLVDSGAPALFVATETAKKVGLVPARDSFWTPIDRLDIEGGARLAKVKARIEDPFQLVGMNALGIAGASIDGILGFTILARYRLEIDLTRDRMTWTRLDSEPRDPPVPPHKPGEPPRAPAGVQALSALGPLAKGLAFLMGKQPEEQRHSRGFLGLEWSERVDGGRTSVQVRRVLKGSPAAKAGLEPGDRILRIEGREVPGLKEARAALAEVQPGDTVAVVVRRGSGADAREPRLTLTAGEGL
ncbi:MAG TPA: PDZ domain-containing protein [Isosphaeraceae bacterium]|nr:PDZ domain-containing protein [Isosphaeraceae bacterium]